ncbi:MAG: YbaB/EbfC family nucleoid-associated protein [Leptospiraceae bacterium]|nr:YbaB/EbfC family nucleoid-associated protein [Leptospiraceae bacterium]MCK6381491.1 YbaB/EbfC family nucleoid-associated protein [Leptospiraceae bacterium]NUM41738.1 YbaB/EbfC family nucleoid-associated protein [Leptospiraceae bacterium]
MSEGNLKFTEIFAKVSEMKKQMEEVQGRVSKLRITSTAGAGMVNVTISGDGVIKNIEINKGLFEGEDVKMLEDLILSAVNDAYKKSKEATEHELKSITGGLGNLPDFLKPFGGFNG